MALIKPQKFFVPAVFLLLLGLGNMYVGNDRQLAHQEILDELEATEALPDVATTSPLIRMQILQLSQEKLVHRQKTAESRVAFYRLVTIGGRALCLLSGVFFAISLLLALLHRTQTDVAHEQPLSASN